MLTTFRFSEFDTSAICRAVLIFCLGSPVEFYCKTCFEVLRIASTGTNIENNATLILCCDAGTGYLIGTASTVCRFLITDYFIFFQPAFCAVAVLRESYTIF